jgi:hypothetical protein
MLNKICAFLLASLWTITANAATSVTQYGITWTFSADLATGQYANGDYYVVDPGAGVQITAISPGYTTSPRAMNGSQLNPKDQNQGFDSQQYNYDAGLNVGITLPLTVAAGNSLVTSIGEPAPSGAMSKLKTAAILTVVSSAPPAGSFRPGYSDPEKEIYGNVSDLNYDMLADLEPTASAPDPATYAANFQRTWLMHSPSWTSRYMHPTDNIPDNYYYQQPLSIAALLLNCNYSNAQKETLLINFIQHGIDLYGVLKARGYGWTSAAGVGWGRKWPILFAGIMLDEPDMKNIGQVSGDYLFEVEGYGPGNNPPLYIRFAEDADAFRVSQTDVDQSAKPLSCADIETCTIDTEWCPDCRAGTPMPYTTAMIGMPEWGHRYSDNKAEIDSAWYANYRTIGVGTRYFSGTALAVMVMGAKTLWNHDVTFDYTDRYMSIAEDGTDPFGYTVQSQAAGNDATGFVGEMWDTYRMDYPYPPYSRRYAARLTPNE